MSTTLSQRRRPPQAAPAPSASPAARRSGRPTWRDPRLVVGLAIVVASVVLGARTLGAADDTVPVYRLAAALSAGESVQEADLEETAVRFTSSEDADRYVAGGTRLPGDVVATRDLGVGELLPRAALGPAASAGLTDVPLAVASSAVPPGLAVGTVVDVWVTPALDAAGGNGVAVRALDDVPVTAAPAAADGFGATTERQVVVGVDESQPGLARALGRIAGGAVVLTAQAGS